jgi:hypothetical protein
MIEALVIENVCTSLNLKRLGQEGPAPSLLYRFRAWPASPMRRTEGLMRFRCKTSKPYLQAARTPTIALHWHRRNTEAPRSVHISAISAIFRQKAQGLGLSASSRQSHRSPLLKESRSTSCPSDLPPPLQPANCS